jgi:hypothetical protein
MDELSFPRSFFFSFISRRKEEISKTVHSRKEYLNLILENLKILEKEYEEQKDKIYSE